MTWDVQFFNLLRLIVCEFRINAHLEAALVYLVGVVGLHRDHLTAGYNGVKLKASFGGAASPDQHRRVERILDSNLENARGPNLMPLETAVSNESEVSNATAVPIQPTTAPEPTEEPTDEPSPEPSPDPTDEPTEEPTPEPSP